MTYGEAEKMVKKTLSKKRFTHTVNVKDKAVELARLYGASEEKAALAAILHDAAKELPKEELLQILRENAIIAGDAENSPPPVWHGVCAAILAQTRWGVEDREVLDAIEPGQSISIIIGPEGGFAPEEIQAARESMDVISLGKRILRTDTAGICTMSVLMCTLEMKEIQEA